MFKTYTLKYLFITLTLSCLTLPSFAQKQLKEKITGFVKTTDNHPAEFISVSLKGTTYGAVTNNKGYFEFEAPAGEYTMVVYSISAHRSEYPITIKTGTKNNFPNLTIIENKNQLDEVVVTGQFYPQSLKKSVYKVRVINNEQIQQKAATNIQALLNTEIGIRMSNDMALGETNFEIMGMSGNNIKVLMDGIPLIDRTSTKQSLSQIDINTIERIEIVEGPMSVAYGADALAGVINIITKKGVSEGKNLSVSARIQEESIGKEYDFFTKDGSHTQSIGVNYKLNNGLYASGNFTHNDFGGWQGDSTGRKKQWQPKEQFLLGGKIGYSKKNLNVSYRLDYMNENILTRADINPVTNITSDKKFIVDRYTHQLQADFVVNNQLSFAASGAYQDYHRKTQTTTIYLNTGKKELSTESGAQAVIDYSDFFSRIAATWKPIYNLTLQPGVEFQSSEGTGDRVEGKHRINNTAIFLAAEYIPIQWLSLQPGVRTSFNSAYDVPWAVPSMNVKVKINDKMDLRLSYGRGFRAPTLQELYYSFHDSNHNIDGNPDLKAEYSNSYMASYTWRPIHNEKIRITSTLSGFYNDFRDRIIMVQDESTGYYKYNNMERYKTVGITFENIFAWKESLKASLALSYIGRYNKLYELEQYSSNDMSEFRFSPEIAANISYDIKKVANISLFYKMTGRRYEYTASNNVVSLTGMNAFHWADFTATRKINKYLDAQAGVKNIFDITTVRNTGSSGSAHSSGTGFSQMACGRSYFVGILFNY